MVTGLTGSHASERCFSCGGSFTVSGSVTHAYMLSSPGCWDGYGVVLAREYQSPALFGAAHRMTVDAYALQHPGDPADRRAVQSVWVHFVALHLLLDLARPAGSIPPIMQRLVRQRFPPLPSRPDRFAVTHAQVLARPIGDHVAAVHTWAECAYSAWSSLRTTADELLSRL